MKMNTLAMVIISVAAFIAAPPARADCTAPAGRAGTMDYFGPPENVFKFCNGTAWSSMGFNLPAGAILAYDLTTCPDGWAEYVPARGRFLRGIDNGAGQDPDGSRTPGALQADAFKSHNHTIVAADVFDPSLAFIINDGSGDYIVSADNSGAPTAAVIRPDRYYTQSSGGAETRPKNVAVLFCRKT